MVMFLIGLACGSLITCSVGLFVLAALSLKDYAKGEPEYYDSEVKVPK